MAFRSTPYYSSKFADSELPSQASRSLHMDLDPIWFGPRCCGDPGCASGHVECTGRSAPSAMVDGIAPLVPQRTVITLPMPIRCQPYRGTIADLGHIAVLVGDRSEYNAPGLRSPVKDAWPTVHQRLPQARLEVYGDWGSMIDPRPAGVRLHAEMRGIECRLP